MLIRSEKMNFKLVLHIVLVAFYIFELVSDLLKIKG